MKYIDYILFYTEVDCTFELNTCFSNQTTMIRYGVQSVRVKRSEWVNATDVGSVWEQAVAELSSNAENPTWGKMWDDISLDKY